jgi:hypothetical protein
MTAWGCEQDDYPERQATTMRTLIIGAVLAVSVVSVGRGQAQQPGRNSIVIAPNIARTLTISRSGVIVATLNIPQGTIISVTFDTAENGQPAGNGRFVFHGNVEIHAVAASQRTEKLWDAMLRQAPIQLTASGVDVAIAPQYLG